MALHDYHLPDARARGHAGRSVPLHFWGVLGHLGQHLLDQGLRGGDLYLRPPGRCDIEAAVVTALVAVVVAL